MSNRKPSPGNKKLIHSYITMKEIFLKILLKRALIPLLVLACSLQMAAQYKVQFILKEKTAIRHDSIYIAGTFNNWDSLANKNYLLRPLGASEKSIVLNLPKGTIRFKFHRGNWLTVEKQYSGNEVSDRIVKITADTTLTDSVASWRDEMVFDKKFALRQQKEDTSRVTILAAIASNYAFWPEYYNSDSALFYANEALQLQQKIIKSGESKLWAEGSQSYLLINLQEILASLFHSLGNYPKALELRLANLNLAEKEKDKSIMAFAVSNIMDDYTSMSDYVNVLQYGKLLDSMVMTLDSNKGQYKFLQKKAKYAIANAFYKLDLADSALYYAKKSASIKLNTPQFDTAFSSLLLGNIYAKMGDNNAAFYHYRLVYRNAFLIYNPQIAASAFEGISKLLLIRGQTDSALYYARQALALLQQYKLDVRSWGENADTYVAEISPLIAEIYQAKNQPDSAYKYLRLSVTLKDSLYNTNKIRQFQTLLFNDAARRQQLEQQSKEAQQQYTSRVKIYGLIFVILGILALAFILYRNNQQKQKANAVLQTQKQELETTLAELKTTQKQLIQSEKMASLGELTAGIAHEIQNPLNFVNNFSEVNAELIDEMQQELKSGNAEAAINISNSIKENQEKINHHGKRADAIVKGMLQHSRSSSGVKEPTNINALADEYLRLAYHGLRARDKSFNASMKTDFDERIGSINIIPQDIGRVILNLITNAFYVVDEKKKSGIENYEPIVSVSTKRMNNKVEIRIKDNGNGIPQKVLDKIFQPFFTTKPTGQGTGLGLSLSYDIVKAHEGDIKVLTKEGEGSEFIIELPV
jgi:two-component system, NtrC family, sensor kinase